MTPLLKAPPKNNLPWAGIAWFGLILVADAGVHVAHLSIHDLGQTSLVDSAVPDNPVLAGAIHAALTATRDAVFSATFPA